MSPERQAGEGSFGADSHYVAPPGRANELPGQMRWS